MFGIVGAGHLPLRAVPVTTHLLPDIECRIGQIGNDVAEQRGRGATEPGADVNHIATILFGVTGATFDMAGGQFWRAGQMQEHVAVLPHIAADNFRIRCDPLYVRAGAATHFVRIRFVWIKQIRSGLAAGCRINGAHEHAAVVVGGAAKRQHPIMQRQENIVVVGMRRSRRIVGAIDGDVVIANVLDHFARQRSTFPHPGAAAPAVNIVAAVVGVATAVEQQITAIAVPGKTTPSADDFRRLRIAGIVQRPQRRWGPDFGVQVQVRTQPFAIRRGRGRRQQLGQIGLTAHRFGLATARCQFLP